MTPDDYDPFLEVLAGFAELKGRALSPPAIKLWWRAMQHWELADFRAAAEHLLRSCEFMPTPKDFEDVRRAGAPTAGEAWAAVLEHVKGAYRTGAGLDSGGPIDAAVEALGGYKAIAFYDVAFLGVLERRFAEHYADRIGAEEIRVAVPQLAGEPARPRLRSDGLRRLGHEPVAERDAP